MEYRQIVAVTGLSGLYQLMSTKNDGAIVRSLADKSIKFVSARIHHITPLESIEIYTTSENVRLHTVLEKIKEQDGPVTDLNSKKDDKAAKAFFKQILPDYDEERVYTSDIKKVLKWYALLKANDLLNFDYLNQALAEEAEEVIVELPTTEEKSKKKVAKKETDATEVAAENTEEAKAPAKKAAAKKKKTSADTEETEAKAAPKKPAAKKKKEAE
jgi:hypothetical protein